MFLFSFVRKGISEAVVAGFNDGLQAVNGMLSEAQALREKDKKSSPETIEGDFREVLLLPAAKRGK